MEPMKCRHCFGPITKMSTKGEFGYARTTYVHTMNSQVQCTSNAAPPAPLSVYVLTAATAYDGVQLIGVYDRSETCLAEYPEVDWKLEQTGQEIYSAVFPDESVWTLTMQYVTER